MIECEAGERTLALDALGAGKVWVAAIDHVDVPDDVGTAMGDDWTELGFISEDGVTTVFAAGPEFKILAENDLADYTLSSPAISDGQIFLRTTRHLYCIGKRVAASR
mgnify:CR=1 FL=1